MFNKKKNNNPHQSNGNQQKKFLQLQMPSTLSEELRVQTLPSIDLRAHRTTQYTKPLSYKKNISRKTTSRTMRFENSLGTNCLNSLLRTTNDNKKVREHDRKSKSPANKRSKSGAKLKLQPKRAQIKYKSEKRLSLKIDDTLRRLDFFESMQGQDETIVYPSASSRMPHAKTISNLSQLSGINFEDFQNFRSVQKQELKLKVDLKSGDSLQEAIAAVTIQRAWRRYKTRMLIERYAQFSFDSFNQSQRNFSTRLPDVQNNENQSMGFVPSEHFYGDETISEVKNVSSLQESQGEALDSVVEEIKMIELQKWNSILKMIEASKEGSQQDREKLFEEITRQSQQNRQELLTITQNSKKEGTSKDPPRFKKIELKAQIVVDRQPSIEQSPESIDKLANYLESIQSENRQEINGVCLVPKPHTESESQNGNYNSKKYIDYLDCDVYHEISQSSSSTQGLRNALGVTTISTRKQEMLLEALYARPVRLPQYGHSSSLSLTSIDRAGDEGPQAPRRDHTVRRSTSEKVFKRNVNEQDRDINLKILEQEYLQMYPILNDDIEEINLDVQSLTGIMTSELKEQNKMDDPQPINCPEVSLKQQLQQLLDQFNSIEREHQQDSQNCSTKEFALMKSDKLAEVIIGSLAMQLLRDLTSSNVLTSSIKRYAESVRPRVRRADGNRKKRGFLTDKREVELFLQNLINHLINQEFTTINHLEVSTGPTALQMLKYMHTTDDDEASENADSQQANIMVIPNRIFDAFWKIKERSIVVQVPANFSQEHSIAFRQNIQYLKSFNKIFYRSLFDTYNECLDWERNFGVLGKPFPWKTAPNFPHRLTSQQKKKSMQNARTKMLTLSTTYCGLMVDSEQIGNTEENQEYLEQVQEDRLSRMLASDLLESEIRWHFYDDEQAEILIEISNVIYRELIFDVLEEVLDFQ